MNAELFLNNLARYSLQVGLLIGVAALLPALLRMRHAGTRLAFLQVLLAACLILPLVQPITPNIVVVSRPAAIVPVAAATATAVEVSGGSEFRMSYVALGLLAAGVLARLAWLALGFWRLRRYRKDSTPLDEADGWTFEADVRVSPQIASPVTFGLRKPVVLLPANFPALHPLVREAILCHECMHIRRRDWAFIVIEESIRAALWFHPAIWWLLEEIQLTREQAVDRAAVELTKARDEYVDALLSVATAKPALDLAPAPLFLRKRHLKRRVVSILKEAHMSKKMLYSALTAGLCLMATACWLVSGAFPLAAAPQVAMDAPGVSVDLGSASLMHRTPVQYPAVALTSQIQGVVVVEATLDKAGNVIDARVVSGPEALRRTALESVLQWHFAPAGGGATRQVAITFGAPEQTASVGFGAPQGGSLPEGVFRVGGGVTPPVLLQKVEPQYTEEARKAGYAGTVVLSAVITADGSATNLSVQRPLGLGLDEQAIQAVRQWRFRPGMRDGQPVAVVATIEVNFRPTDQGTSVSSLLTVSQAANAGVLGPVISSAPTPSNVGAQIAEILVFNLSEQAKADLLSRLPVHKGDLMEADTQAKLTAAVREFDEHLVVSVGRRAGGNDYAVLITTPTSPGSLPATSSVPATPGVQRIKVGANVQQANLVSRVQPVYPPLAKQSRIQGHVILAVVIGPDGTMRDIKATSGHPLLVSAAMDAVRQWQYKPTMLNGNPVEVSTEIDVNFTLAEDPPPAPPQQ